jgi:hypothetical protein
MNAPAKPHSVGSNHGGGTSLFSYRSSDCSRRSSRCSQWWAHRFTAVARPGSTEWYSTEPAHPPSGCQSTQSSAGNVTTHPSCSRPP